MYTEQVTESVCLKSFYAIWWWRYELFNVLIKRLVVTEGRKFHQVSILVTFEV